MLQVSHNQMLQVSHCHMLLVSHSHMLQVGQSHILQVSHSNLVQVSHSHMLQVSHSHDLGRMCDQTVYINIHIIVSFPRGFYWEGRKDFWRNCLSIMGWLKRDEETPQLYFMMNALFTQQWDFQFLSNCVTQSLLCTLMVLSQ